MGSKGMEKKDKIDFVAGFEPLLRAYCEKNKINNDGFAVNAGVTPVQVSGTLNLGPNFAGYSALQRMAREVGSTVERCISEGKSKKLGISSEITESQSDQELSEMEAKEALKLIGKLYSKIESLENKIKELESRQDPQPSNKGGFG